MKKRNLEEWMVLNRYTQASLSRALKLVPSSVFEWINHGRVPQKRTMDRFTALIKEVDRKPFSAQSFFVK